MIKTSQLTWVPITEKKVTFNTRNGRSTKRHDYASLRRVFLHAICDEKRKRGHPSYGQISKTKVTIEIKEIGENEAPEIERHIQTYS